MNNFGRKLIGFILLFIILFFGKSFAAEQIYVSITDEGSNINNETNQRLYTLDASGGEPVLFFDFSGGPKETRGMILNIRSTADKEGLIFASDNNAIYTPTGRNIFRVSADGARTVQLTPGPHSGLFNLSCPCGTVSGSVTDSVGRPYIGSSVFLEGVGYVPSDGNGKFSFNNVPPGERWIVAYRPADLTVFDTQLLSVISGLAVTNVQLSPDSGTKPSYEYPVQWGEYIYFRHAQWISRFLADGSQNANQYANIYQVSGCNYFIDGFDVAPKTGRLAIIDYESGCASNRGIYIMDSDGNNPQLFLDFKDPNSPISDGREIFWSPDESKLAFTASLNYTSAAILLYDAVSGVFLDGIVFDQRYTLYQVGLYGWNSSGDALLYCITEPDSLGISGNAQSSLISAKVGTSGGFDAANFITLLSGKNIRGAAWADLSKLSAPDLSVIVNGTEVTASWTDVSGAEGYRLYYAPASDITQIGSIDMGRQTSISVTLPPGAEFYTAVRAYTAGLESNYSNIELFRIR